uniref:Uncharacterized protein n=1 Tax=viral metagenome TaxID=1070528 RepID=A0A6C0BH24_9ZZZZ
MFINDQAVEKWATLQKNILNEIVLTGDIQPKYKYNYANQTCNVIMLIICSFTVCAPCII